MHLEKADLFQKFAALFKIGLRLAGEATDAVGGKADRALPVGGAQLVHHLCVLLGSVNAAHPAQGGSAEMCIRDSPCGFGPAWFETRRGA